MNRVAKGMKKIKLIVAILFIIHVCYAQSEKVNYFGLKPPGELPEKFAPTIISKDKQYVLMSAFSPDGKQFCFTTTNEHWSHFEIWYTRYDAGKWSVPEVLPFMKSAGGFGPVFSPDSKTIYFGSSNWVTHPSAIWYSTRRKNAWSSAVKLRPPVNTGADQWQFTMAKDSTLIFTSKRPGGKGGYDLYMSKPEKGRYLKALNITELNSSADEYSAFIAPDKSYMIFSSQRAGSYGWDDLYVSFLRKNGTWTKPINLGPQINTKHAEFSPQVSPDGKYLIYSKWDIKNKWSVLYWVRIDKTIERLKKQSGI